MYVYVGLYTVPTSFGLFLKSFLALLRSFFCGVSSLEGGERERGGGNISKNSECDMYLELPL